MNKEDIILSLNRILANFFVIFIKLYRYQWYAKGSHAYTMTMFFKELQLEMDTLIKDLSEYILSLNGRPYATMIKYVKESTIEEATADDEEEEMTYQLFTDLQVILEQISALAKEADEPVRHYLYDLERVLKLKYAFIEKMRN